jgi:NAD(P)-dependent dehydrogenase (short-subunit alcohol dehydrogenase family)
LISRAAEELGGPIDVLVNNAAINAPASILSDDPQSRYAMFELNLHTPIDLMKQATPAMVSLGAGWIVNISSGTARHALGPPFDQRGLSKRLVGYGASKAALDRITNGAALELWGTGVCVTGVRPRAAVLSEGAVAHGGMDAIPEDMIESMEAMVEAILSLATCEADRSGHTYESLALLDELGRTVMALDGVVAHPGGFRR